MSPKTWPFSLFGRLKLFWSEFMFCPRRILSVKISTFHIFSKPLITLDLNFINLTFAGQASKFFLILGVQFYKLHLQFSR
jgi:hypothetical protein